MNADPNAAASPNLAVPAPRPARVRPAGRPAVPRRKPHLSLRIDQDVLTWFRAPGRGHQTRMNAVLRAYMEHARGNRDRG